MTSAADGRDAPGTGADERVPARRDELAAGLAQVHTRIARAMEAAGRIDEPALVVVTKFFPASDVDLLAGLGVTRDRREP